MVRISPPPPPRALIGWNRLISFPVFFPFSLKKFHFCWIIERYSGAFLKLEPVYVYRQGSRWPARCKSIWFPIELSLDFPSTSWSLQITRHTRDGPKLYAPPFCTKLYALPYYWMIDWMIDVRCLQLFPFFSEKPFYFRSLIFFHSED